MSDRSGAARERLPGLPEGMALPARELRWSYARSSGPGGQNVNKTSTKALMTWDIRANKSLPPDVRGRLQTTFGHCISDDGVLYLQSDRYRDQSRNRKDCLEKLTKMIRAVVVPPKERRATRPSAASERARVVAKRHKSEKKSQRRFARASDSGE